jgi:putative tryptophan/tyrosine transport system substrate-binding protein
MKRRTFVVASAAALTMPGVVRSQQRVGMRRLAVVHPTDKPAAMTIAGDSNWVFFFRELNRLGYAEAVNIIIDRYSGEGRYDYFPELAHEIVATRPDVIFAVSNNLVKALRAETQTVPIVGWMGSPVALGLVSSLARPGGNITGITVDASLETAAKHLELLAEAVGGLSNAGVLGLPTGWDGPVGRQLRDAADKRKVRLQPQLLRPPVDEAEYRRAFDAMRQDHVDGVLISTEAENYTHRALLGQLAREYRLPAICWFSDSVDAGALMSYAHDLKAGFRHLAAQIVEILHGGKVAEMPVVQEVHWELVINLAAAKELGLEIPAGLVARSDRVIE